LIPAAFSSLLVCFSSFIVRRSHPQFAFGASEDQPILAVLCRDFQLLEGKYDIFLANAKELVNANNHRCDVAVAVDHQISDIADLVIGGIANTRFIVSEASQWLVESEDGGLVTTERPVDGSLVIVVSAKTRPLAKARTAEDKATLFSITDVFPHAVGSERRGRALGSDVKFSTAWSGYG
jgi:hypothetical protein